MTCIKTGAHVHLAFRNQYAYGDAFEEEGVLIIRICALSFKPINHLSVKHFTVEGYDYWFDEAETSMAQNSTMICSPALWIEHGEGEGIPL